MVERLVELIREYLRAVFETALLFDKYKGVPPHKLARARFEGLGVEGYVDPEGTIQFHFHGIGLAVEYPDRLVDWDFGLDGNMDGFDAFRLWVFAKDGTSNFPEFCDKDILEEAFSKAEARGLIGKRFEDMRDRLYYLN